MATELTNPIAQAAITHQGVTSFSVQIPHMESGGNALINLDKVKVRYEVTSWSSDGKVAGREAREVPYADWPAVFITDMNAIYQKIVIDAKANNLIQPGTDEPIS